TRERCVSEEAVMPGLVPGIHVSRTVIPGWSEGPDRRCAIAHLGISRFSGAQLRTIVRCSASPRNDDGTDSNVANKKGVDGRVKPGHDDRRKFGRRRKSAFSARASSQASLSG